MWHKEGLEEPVISNGLVATWKTSQTSAQLSPLVGMAASPDAPPRSPRAPDRTVAARGLVDAASKRVTKRFQFVASTFSDDPPI
jgi:hypothetical protein